MTEKPQPTAGAFWEQLEGESATAYGGFCVYRDQGITRSLARAAREFYRQDKEHQENPEGAPNTAAHRRFKEWSRHWMWVSRVESFDAEEARDRSLRMRERRIKMSEQHFAVGSLALNRAAQRLQQMGMDEQIPLKNLAPLIRAGADLQRLAVGEPTAIEDVRSTRHAEKEMGMDVRTLSQEDQEELARIAGYLDDFDDLPN